MALKLDFWSADLVLVEGDRFELTKPFSTEEIKCVVMGMKALLLVTICE
jgi:hypothetical protein